MAMALALPANVITDRDLAQRARLVSNSLAVRIKAMRGS